MNPAANEAAFPGANGRILFNSERDGNRELYMMEADGSNQQNFTGTAEAFESRGEWSPGGGKIVYQRLEGGYDEIFTIDLNGIVDQLTDFGGGPVVQQDCCPSWSPDGTRVLFSRWYAGGNNDVFVMNADGSNVTNLTNSVEDDFGAEWSPNGQKIAFQRQIGGNYEVFVMNPDGSNPTALTNDGGDNGDPEWSPDGSRIAYYSGTTGNNEIWAMNADGSGKVNLTNHPSDEFSPAWSPDGNQIAFTSLRDGNAEVYVMNADGSEQTRLTNNPAPDGDFFVDWQPLMAWGDNNCSGAADPVDALLALRHDAGLDTNTGACPEMGALVQVQGTPRPWGDIDCSGGVDPVDSLKTLRYDAGLSVAQAPGCPSVGSPIDAT
jgi:TolB protein